MAKEVAFSKIAKISKARQYMIIAVLGASAFLGAGISLTMHFTQVIAFNAKVIAAEEESIAAYTQVIKETGICKAPKGSVYSGDELKKCDPDNIEISEIPDTLRYNILEKLAANEALNSVQKEGDSNCINPKTGRNYTFAQLNKEYKNATDSDTRQLAIRKIKSCSALRIIPDALPAFKNEEALLASLNRIFNLSGWEPESLGPSTEINDEIDDLPDGLNPIDVSLSIEAPTGTTMNILRNVERSIRDFDIYRATIEWENDNTLDMKASATAYYVNESTITETNKSITAGGN
ncbi:hypothetical protein IKG60_01305 [Candidatus Saccharibacteria bacterium]|nr:hypothetical protein [Candidatus Saccharibacteria bacterium]